MPPIQAGTDPNIPYPRHTFWFWELTNIFIPLFGILFLDWHIFTLVFLFWWELICWGSIGALKILSANGGETSFLARLFAKLIILVGFIVLYLGLFLIVFSFTFTEFDTESMISMGRGVRTSMFIIGANYVFEYIRSELVTWRFLIRNPIEVVFERIIYALPLACLVLFAVTPLSQRFEDAEAEKIIAVGIILSKFIMDVAAHSLPGIMFKWNDMNDEEVGDDEMED